MEPTADPRVPRPTSPAVSVVIPVYNPGRDIDRCIDSLLGQSLPERDIEVVLVDDGSTDDTPDRLDRLAAEHPHLRVIHTPNSGWPGRPRNIGIECARGEYVQFVDQDDHLAPEALERLVTYGREHAADIVIGKVASDFRGVALGVFAKNRPSCTIHDAPLIDSLTPHKMFRREWLVTNGLAFPEGRRRLEDQLFMVRTYFQATSVAILADYPSYFYYRRRDGHNAGSTLIVPDEYYGNLREVLDVVLEHTTPGEDRDRLLRRFLRVEVLGRLSEPSYPGLEGAYRTSLFRAARSVVLETMEPSVDEGMGMVRRRRAGALRDDRPEDLLAIAERASALHVTCRIRSATWRAGKLVVEVDAAMEDDDGRPLEVIQRDDRSLLPSAAIGLPPGDPIDVTEEIGAIRAAVWVRDEVTSIEWRVPSPSRVGLLDAERTADGDARVRPTLAVTATLDPRTLALGRPLADGRWVVWLRLSAFGLDLRTQLGGERSGKAQGPRAFVLDEPFRVALATWMAGVQGGPGLDVSSDGTGARGAVAPAEAPRGQSLRLDVTTIPAPRRGRGVPVMTAADDASPNAMVGRARRDLAGQGYFEEVGLRRRIALRRAAGRYARPVWRRLPDGVKAPIRAVRRRVRPG